MFKAKCEVNKRWTAMGNDRNAYIPWEEEISGKPRHEMVGFKWTRDGSTVVEGGTFEQFTENLRSKAKQIHAKSGRAIELVRLKADLHGPGFTVNICADYPYEEEG